MQRNVPQPQNFQDVPTTQIDRLITQYTELSEQIDKAKNPQAGQFKASLPPQMLQTKENDLALLKQQIRTQLANDLRDVQANYNLYVQALKGMMQMAKQRLDSAKTAAKLSAKTKRQQDIQAAVHETAGAARDIQQLLDTAETDSSNFGKSWFAYRGMNPHLPDDIAGDFLAQRTELINDAKATHARLQKFKELSTQVKALNKLSADLAMGARQDATQTLQEATALAKKVSDEAALISNGGPGLKLGWLSAQAKYNQLHADATNKQKNAKTDLKVGEDRFADAMASTKIIRAKIKSLKVVMDSGVKGFTKEERAVQAVKAKLAEAQASYNTAAALLRDIERAEIQAKKDIEAMRKRIPRQ